MGMPIRIGGIGGHVRRIAPALGHVS